MKKIISLIFSLSFFGSKLFAQCPAGDVPIFLEAITDPWGYECYWEIVPSGNACGTGTLASGGNTVVGCSGATANPSDPGAYANFDTITEGPFCLTDGSTYDLIFVDSYGDGGTAFTIITNPVVTTNFSGFGGTASFVASALPAAEAEMVSTTISKYYATNTNLYIEATIKNRGSDPITNIDLIWTDGTNTYTDNLTGLNISTWTTQTLTHSIPFNSSTVSVYDLDVYISLTGDLDNTNDTISAITIGVENPPIRNHVYEEATGTWLGWAPRGFVAMKELTSYSNAIPITVHNGDLMVNSTYDNGIANYIGGYPSGLVNRGAIGETDPGNFVSIHTGGTLLEITPVATTTNIIGWDPSTRIATIEVVGTFHSDLQGDYRLNLIVTEDSVKETSSGYNQTNYYGSNAISLPDTDVNGNAVDWMNLSNPVAAVDINSIFGGYHHVARSIEGGWIGITNSIPTIATNGASYDYVFNVNIDAGWNENNLHFIGWLTETATGEILNASTSSLADSVATASPLTITSSSIDETCGNSNGSASVTATLGSGSYTYTWNNGGAGSSQINLIAGTYSVTISDGTDSVVESIIVGLGSTASSMTATNSSTDSDCGLSNGSASTTVSGESGTVSYIWNNGGTDATITGITAGTYTVTYTDDTGCPETETVQVGSSGGFSTNPTPTNVSCFGGATGKVSISVSGAIGDVSYIWNNGATTSVITGLIAGTYFITATDSVGCVISSSAVILEPLSLTQISSSTSSTCDNADGSVSATASGGESPYSYLWSNGVMGENNTNIVSGFYTVTIIDNNGCITTGSESVTSASAPITTSVSLTNEDCGSNNGVATISASGGVGGFTYLWSNGQSASTAVNLEPVHNLFTIMAMNASTTN
ncbi:MAG: hypothetical protein JKY53_11710 [Flavobacteriales bacterium]|nr:hypothetical protein [Flavobacteriales bacterium]